MFCNKCGSPLEKDAKFCVSCGNPVEAPQSAPEPQPQPQYQQPPQQPQYQAPVYYQPYQPPVQQLDPYREQRMASLAGSILGWGIAAIICSEFGLIGLIATLIARGKVKEFLSLNSGIIYGKAKVGKILCNVALPLSIVMTVFWAIYILYFVLIFVVMGAAVDGVEEIYPGYIY